MNNLYLGIHINNLSTHTEFMNQGQLLNKISSLQEELALAIGTIESRDRNIEIILSESNRRQIEIDQLNLAEEGSKEAFGVVVDQKRDIEARCLKSERNLRSLNDHFLEVILQRNELSAFLVKIENSAALAMPCSAGLEVDMRALISKMSH